MTPTTLDLEAIALADARFGRLRPRVLARISRLLAAAAIDPAGVACTLEGDVSTLTVILELPVPVSGGLEQALGVRVLDAVHSSGLTFGTVAVVVRGPQRAGAGGA